MDHHVCDVCGTPYRGRTFDPCPCCGGRERIPDGCTCGQLKNTLGVPLNTIVDKNPNCPIHGAPIEIVLPPESRFGVESNYAELSYEGVVSFLVEENSSIDIGQLLANRPAFCRAWNKGRCNWVLFQLGRHLRRVGLRIEEFTGAPWMSVLQTGYEW